MTPDHPQTQGAASAAPSRNVAPLEIHSIPEEDKARAAWFDALSAAIERDAARARQRFGNTKETRATYAGQLLGIVDSAIQRGWWRP